MSETQQSKPDQKIITDVLTKEEAGLIKKVLSKAFLPGLLRKVETEAHEVEKRFPLGTPHSAQAYERMDGRTAELVAINKLKSMKELDPKVVEQIDQLFADHVFTHSTRFTPQQEAKAMATLDALEATTPLAATFRAARKVQKFGRTD